MDDILNQLTTIKTTMVKQVNSFMKQRELLRSNVAIYRALGCRHGDLFENDYQMFNDYSQQITCLEWSLEDVQKEIDLVISHNRLELNGVHSEAGRLECVLMHRPGNEIRRLIPENLSTLLFDAIPNLNDTHTSHDRFAEYLREQDVNVLYVSDILRATMIGSPLAFHELIDGIIKNTDLSPEDKNCLRLWLEARSPGQLARDVIEGVACTVDELGQFDVNNLLSLNGFVVPPLPNMMFTRDSFSIIKNKVVIHKMAFSARQNEPLIMSIIFKYYPKFVEHFELIDWEQYVPHPAKATMEGGDLAYVGDGTLLIGWSQRTNRFAIDALAQAMFESGTLNRVIVVKVPENRDYMHLDTVLSSVGCNAFTLHARLAPLMDVYEVIPDISSSTLWISRGTVETLGSVLGGETLTLYDSKMDNVSIEDQINCRHNVLAIDAHHVVTYGGGDEENGIVTQMRHDQKLSCIVFCLSTAGLLEGAGGAHCLTNALSRRSIE